MREAAGTSGTNAAGTKLESLDDKRAAHNAIQSLRGYSGGTMLAPGLRQAALIMSDVSRG